MSAVNARRRNQVRAIRRWKHELLVQRSRVPAKWAPSRLHARPEQFELSHVPTNRLSWLYLQQIRKRAIKPEDPVVRVMPHDEIRDRAEILHPLLPRPLNPRDSPHI